MRPRRLAVDGYLDLARYATKMITVHFSHVDKDAMGQIAGICHDVIAVPIRPVVWLRGPVNLMCSALKLRVPTM